MEQKTFFITTLGCPKNAADSLHMEESLLKEGLTPASSPSKSDFHLINTCTFIQSATQETIDTILDATKWKKKRKQKLVVVGCFAERYPDAIREDIPEVDLCFGTGKYNKAGEIIKKYFPNDFSKIADLNAELITREKVFQSRKKNQKPYSFVKVSDGCNRGCHFCIIPNLRGEFKDTSESQILDDIAQATSFGAKEICLVSQDTVFYGKSTDQLKSLLGKITQMDSVHLLRLLYLYPDKKTFHLLDHMIQDPKIAPYLESPIQHVSEKMLKAMNRSGNPQFFRELFAKAREKKDLEIRTSIIIGYPGETASDVDEVLRFVEDVKPEKLALFSFSGQEGTKAFQIPETVSEEEKAIRINMVRELHLEILKSIHQNRIGKTYSAIVDEVEKEEAIVRRFQDAPEIDEIVRVPKTDLVPGQIGKVKINSFTEYDMDGDFFS